MLHRTARTSFVLLLLLGLTLLVSASPVGATTRSTGTTRTGRSFHPTGHGQVEGRMVSTKTIPQVKGTGRGTIPPRPAPGSRAHVPAPTHVVRIAAPAHSSPNEVVKASFVGQSENGWQPSDSNGTPGTQNYMEMINEQFEIYDRSGNAQYGTSFNTWFNQSGSLFDPKAVWDKRGGRFIFMVDTGSSLILSVAQQTNGVGNYCNYLFPTLSGYFADYPQLGVDENGVYFEANMYPNSGSVITELFDANRTELETCAGTSYTYWSGLTNPDGSYAFTIVPAVAYFLDNNTEYLVNSYPGGGCQLTLWSLTSSGNLSNIAVATQCYSPPPPAQQQGSSGTIETLDNRLYQVNYLKGQLSLATVGSYDFGDGLGPVGIVEWFVINASTATIQSQGNFGIQGYWLFFPAMITTGAGLRFFVFNASGPTIYPSIWAISGCLCDTISVAWGTSYYGTSGTARWGDYQSAWLDPVPNIKKKLVTVWVTGQYANGTDNWGTWVSADNPHK